MLLVQNRQAWSAMVESASYTNAYYWYNTDVSLLRDCWERSRTPTLITRTIQTSLVCDCWGCLVHSSLLLVQYRHAWCATVDKASYTHSYYSYNADKPDVRLLRALRTLRLITRTIQTSLMCDCWGCFVHSGLLLVQYRQAWCAIVEGASYTQA